MAEQVVYLNGQFVALSEATVPVLDRGFIFGDGIYDVIPVYQRKMLRAQHHLARLTRRLSAVGIESGVIEADRHRSSAIGPADR